MGANPLGMGEHFTLIVWAFAFSILEKLHSSKCFHQGKNPCKIFTQTICLRVGIINVPASINPFVPSTRRKIIAPVVGAPTQDGMHNLLVNAPPSISLDFNTRRFYASLSCQ